MPFQKGFQKAMELVKSEFLERVFYFKDSWLPARSLVEDAVKKRFEACLFTLLLLLSFHSISFRFISCPCDFSSTIFTHINGRM